MTLTVAAARGTITHMESLMIIAQMLAEDAVRQRRKADLAHDDGMRRYHEGAYDAYRNASDFVRNLIRNDHQH